MADKNEVKYYKNPKFGKLFREYIKDLGTNHEIAEELYKKTTLGKSSLTSIILGYKGGNLLGNNAYTTPNSLPVKEHADRLAYILNSLDVPPSSKMIELARETFDIDFEYPPTSKFKDFKKNFITVRNIKKD